MNKPSRKTLALLGVSTLITGAIIVFIKLLEWIGAFMLSMREVRFALTQMDNLILLFITFELSIFLTLYALMRKDLIWGNERW